MKGRTWTNKEDQIIKQNYKNRTDEELSILLPGRTIGTIKVRRNHLGLRKKFTDGRRIKIIF